MKKGGRRRGYVNHTRHKGEVLKKNLYKAKRWVVERTASWHNRFRKLLVRFEKREENYQALVEFADCLIVYRAIYWQAHMILELLYAFCKIDKIIPRESTGG